MRLKTAVLAVAMLAALATAGRAQDQSSPQSTPAAPQQPMRIRIGGNVQQAKLTSKTQPIYPPLAVQSATDGNVVLHAIIGVDGVVKTLAVISGHPLLIQAALDAVRQWRYQPTLLNGTPVEVDTTITVTFALPTNTQGQQTPPAGGSPAAAPAVEPSPAIDPQLKADVLHLFDVIDLRERETDGAKAMFKTLRPTILASLPVTPNRDKIADAIATRTMAFIGTDDFLDRLAVVYATYLSDDDVKALTAFYQTPGGKHYNAAQAQITTGTSQLALQVIREGVPKMYAQLCTEYPELQGQARFCSTAVPGQVAPFPGGGVMGGVQGGVQPNSPSSGKP
jgi:TonB family protein